LNWAVDHYPRRQAALALGSPAPDADNPGSAEHKPMTRLEQVRFGKEE